MNPDMETVAKTTAEHARPEYVRRAQAAYYERNKDRLVQAQKAYYQENREKIREKYLQKKAEKICHIYRIAPKANGAEGDVYFGATTNDVANRFRVHRSNFRKIASGGETNSRCSSLVLFEKYGEDNCVAEVLETFRYENTSDIASRELHYISSFPCVNVLRPVPIIEENIQKRESTCSGAQKRAMRKYYEKNREAMLARTAEWHAKNPEKSKEHKRRAYERAKARKLQNLQNLQNSAPESTPTQV